MTATTKPDCYTCVHRLPVPGDCHSRCNNHDAHVEGVPHGIVKGWFKWPVNYDPVWLVSCDGYSADPKDRMPRRETDPLLELWGLFK